MSGMSEPKVIHQLQVVRVARYVRQHLGETWLFNYQADPKTLHVYTDTNLSADELTRKSVSCTVERYGSHMIDCSVAKQSLVALSSGEAEFYGIVKAVATSKHTSNTDLGTDRDATGGDHCIRQQCSTRKMDQDRIREGATPFDQRVVDTGSVSQGGVPVGVGGHVVELGRHRNEDTHVRTPDVVVEADATSLERGSDKGVGGPH